MGNSRCRFVSGRHLGVSWSSNFECELCIFFMILFVVNIHVYTILLGHLQIIVLYGE